MYEWNTRSQSHLKKLADRALQWVICSLERFQLKVVAEAVAVQPDGNKDKFVNGDIVLEITHNFLCQIRKVF